MNKFLTLAILVGTSIASVFSQSITINGDIVMDKDTIGTVFSVDKSSDVEGSFTGFNTSVKVYLYQYTTVKEKKQIDKILASKYGDPKYSCKVEYVKNYKNAGDYLIESGKMKHKAILTSIAGTFSGSIIMAIGAVTLNPVLIYTGGSIISVSGISSLVMEIKSNNLLIKSGKKMVADSK